MAKSHQVETELINFDDLEKIISEAVSLSVQETFAGKLGDESRAQEKVSDQIERDNLHTFSSSNSIQYIEAIIPMAISSIPMAIEMDNLR